MNRDRLRLLLKAFGVRYGKCLTLKDLPAIFNHECAMLSIGDHVTINNVFC